VKIQKLGWRAIIIPPKPEVLVPFKRSNPESDFPTIDMQELVQIKVVANSKQSYCYEACESHQATLPCNAP
jgi:hypothetical protein